jgi:SAM-dependent methyltransferase
MAGQSNERADQPPPSVVALNLATAYQGSQAVITATSLGIPDILSNRSMTSREVAEATGTQPHMMHRLLRALAAYDVIEDCGDGTFKLTAVGNSLRADVPGSVRPIVLLFGHDNFWQRFANLAECIKTGQNAYQILYGLPSTFAYLESHPELARVFDDAMSAVSAFTGPAVARAYDFAAIDRIVDVGGGHGRVLASILKEHPKLRGILFDLPRVIEGAPSFLARAGVADRCEVVGGDMFASVPAGGDVYMLSHVIHDWDDECSIKILQACRRAMSPGAKLVIVDRVMPGQIRADLMAQGNARIDLVMMTGTTGGRERTATEFQTILDAAGLRLQRVIPTRTADSLVEAAPV